MKRIFVYGTLKRGYGNNRLLDAAEFLEAKVIHGLKIYYSWGNSGFPVAQRDLNSSTLGEVYNLPDEVADAIIRRLDGLEGNGFMYNREEIEPNLQTYIGHPRSWDFSRMTPCPLIDGRYEWGTQH